MSDDEQDEQASAPEHRYRIAYKHHVPDGGMTKDEAKALVESGEYSGACDAIFGASILYPADGSLSVLFFSKDGRTGKDLDDNEWFKIWSMLSSRLGKSPTLSSGKRELAELVFETICSAAIGPGEHRPPKTGPHAPRAVPRKPTKKGRS